MPTYAYRCTQCDVAFDVVQAFTDAALDTCPECGGRLRKVYGSIGVTFHGGGFYRTDSRAKAPAASSAASGNTSTSSASAPATSSPTPSSSASSTH